MHSGDKGQQSFSFEKSFLYYGAVIFGPLLSVAFIIVTTVVYMSTISHLTPVVDTPEMSVKDIIIFYNLSISIVCSISLLFGYYTAWRESHKQVYVKKSNYLSVIKKFNFGSRCSYHMNLVYGPLMVMTVAGVSVVALLYSSYISKSDVFIVYNLTIGLVSAISVLFAYCRTKRELRMHLQEG